MTEGEGKNTWRMDRYAARGHWMAAWAQARSK
jgi:hypothetical protein